MIYLFIILLIFIIFHLFIIDYYFIIIILFSRFDDFWLSFIIIYHLSFYPDGCFNGPPRPEFFTTHGNHHDYHAATITDIDEWLINDDEWLLFPFQTFECHFRYITSEEGWRLTMTFITFIWWR